MFVKGWIHRALLNPLGNRKNIIVIRVTLTKNSNMDSQIQPRSNILNVDDTRFEMKKSDIEYKRRRRRLTGWQLNVEIHIRTAVLTSIE